MNDLGSGQGEQKKYRKNREKRKEKGKEVRWDEVLFQL